jgi:uncharacterized protein YoxC
MNRNSLVELIVGIVAVLLLLVLNFCFFSNSKINRVESRLEEAVAGVTAENLANSQVIYERVNLLVERVEVIEDDIDDLFTSDDVINSAINRLSQGLGVVEGRIGQAETAIEAVTQTAQIAQQEAQRSNAQHSARIQTENREYLRMVNYIREKNSGFEITQSPMKKFASY